MLAGIRHLDDIDIIPIRRHGQVRYVRRARPSSDAVVYCDPDEGILWLSDLDSDSIFLIVSSRTTWPALAFASVTIELVTGYLAEQGWTLFHAGAVDTASGALMVVGNEGAGKTSLLLALLCGGVRFIANELLFVRKAAEGFRVLGFPRAVAVGLGTAMQFPQLADLIDSPDGLQFPRRRLSLSRIVRTPRSEWKNLEDKLQLLPSELSELLDAPAATPGGTLRALVVPMVNKESREVVAERLSHDSALEVLSDNHIGLTQDSRYRPWLETNFRSGSMDGHDRLLAELSELSPVRFRFGLSLDSFEDTRTYAGRLLNALESESRFKAAANSAAMTAGK